MILPVDFSPVQILPCSSNVKATGCSSPSTIFSDTMTPVACSSGVEDDSCAGAREGSALVDGASDEPTQATSTMVMTRGEKVTAGRP